MKNMHIKTSSSKETFKIGKKIGERLFSKPGDAYIFALDGELGSGKTVFVSGLAAGIGIEEPVLSPSFTIVKEYGGARYNLYHIDLYRLNNPSDLMSFDFYEYAGREASITAIEWANKFGETGFFPKVPTIFVNFNNIEEISETDYLRSIDLKFENFSEGQLETLLEEF